MDDQIIAIRRINLRKWVALNGIPQKEKSLFSQLLGSGSFGERVARRIERDYGIPYLDGEAPIPSAPAQLTASSLMAAVDQLPPIERAMFLAGIAAKYQQAPPDPIKKAKHTKAG